MRIDNNNKTVYKDFWDWLINYQDHVLYMAFLIGGYYVYRTGTTEMD